MNITLAQPEDLEEILELQKKCYVQEAEIYNDFQIPPLTQTLSSIRKDFDNHLFLKAVINDQIVGSVRGEYENNTLKIGRLIVHSDFQNRGIGQQLMSYLEEKDTTVKRYELFTGHKSEKNLALYQKLGYKEFDKKVINDRLSLLFLQKLKETR